MMKVSTILHHNIWGQKVGIGLANDLIEWRITPLEVSTEGDASGMWDSLPCRTRNPERLWNWRYRDHGRLGWASGLKTAVLWNAYKMQLDQVLITTLTRAENRSGCSGEPWVSVTSWPAGDAEWGAERWPCTTQDEKLPLEEEGTLEELLSEWKCELDKEHSKNLATSKRQQGNLPVLASTPVEKMFSSHLQPLLQLLCHFSAKAAMD